MKLDVGANGNDYVNASLIKLDLGSEQSLGPKEYIATQGPTRKTTGHFWQMIYGTSSKTYNSDVITILMLSPVYESGREACAPYWPSEINTSIEVPAGEEFPLDLTVSCVDSKTNVVNGRTEDNQYPYVSSELKLNCEQTGTTKTVHHIYVDSWVDFDRPKADGDIFSLVKLTNSFQEGTTSAGSKPMPLIVHCSAGVGRTGTYMALDYMWTKSKILNISESEWPKSTEDPIYELVLQMREQRMGMVQRFSQYNYIYENVRLALSSEDN